jgi:endonuclease/exonuclease/phosphatase family metal-dependent hydrolase
VSTLVFTLIVCTALVVLLRTGLPGRAAVSCGESQPSTEPPVRDPQSTIRIGTYNIHGGKGTDGRRDLSRTAEVVRGADLVALQEVRSSARSANQVRQLAVDLGLGWIFAPTLRRWCRNYRGNGLLTAMHVSHWQTYHLPNAGGRRFRAYTVVHAMLGDTAVSLLFTHLHTRNGREQQLKVVLEHFANLPVPAVLVGDLNSKPGDAVLARYLPKDHVDAINLVLGTRDESDRVDWILTRGLEITAGDFVAPGVSDHPYYWVDVRV